jgi:hypothetical protein
MKPITSPAPGVPGGRHFYAPGVAHICMLELLWFIAFLITFSLAILVVWLYYQLSRQRAKFDRKADEIQYRCIELTTENRMLKRLVDLPETAQSNDSIDRHKDLELWIRNIYRIVAKNEERLQLEDDPTEQARIKRDLQQQHELILGYYDEYKVLCQRRKVQQDGDIADIALVLYRKIGPESLR